MDNVDITNNYNLIKCYIPNEMVENFIKNHEKEMYLSGCSIEKLNKNQHEYEFFIESISNNSKIGSSIGLLTKNETHAKHFLQNGLQFIICFDSNKKDNMELRLFKNSHQIQNSKFLIIFYNQESNFKAKFFQKSAYSSFDKILNEKKEKLSQNKLISHLNESSYFLENLILTFNILYLCVFKDNNSLRKRSKFYSYLVNLICGALFSTLILLNPYFDAIDWLNNFVANYMQIMMNFLTSTLNWLMGVPVGFKLNTRLAEFLARFFLYHIYLWESSLLIFKSFLPYLINLTLYSGFLGISFMIYFLIDVFTLLTIHTTCFYIYAGRIYKLEIESLKSLFRLFRGKKSNPLRNRIDSYSYNIQQLFIGTLGFCLTFFLLPTVLIFYLVFISLRIVLLLIVNLLFLISSFLMCIPIYEFTLLFASSKFWTHYSEKFQISLSEKFKSNEKITFFETESLKYGLKNVLEHTEWKRYNQQGQNMGILLKRVLNGMKI
ncbi:unnamed protein product [Brachionus calyciflorus]|uniref:Phosphatidylinositol N-acetylglucosaminyltransferase subunit Q n=1 Tax=Brachionus calyciflorus TaxID=104777 RepID=A0A813MA83_9BILA|nr:unnamed protein product [Brachionus calyciflorus]